MKFNFSSSDFKNHIREKKNLISIKTEEGSFFENENFRMLLSLFSSFINDNYITGIKAFYINKKSILSLNNPSIDKIDELFKLPSVRSDNVIVVDEHLNLVSSETKIFDNSNDARKYYNDASKNGQCVFLLIERQITVSYFIDGKDYGDSIFYDEEDIRRFSEKFDIKYIDKVFEDYRKHLEIRENYRKFFVGKASLKTLYSLLISKGEINSSVVSEDDFITTHKQLLNSLPEDRFREDLKAFLESKLKHNLLGKELILESFKRLDIFIQDDLGGLHLIEVKWVGKNLNIDGQKISNGFNENNICPAAIKQSLNYIKELCDTNNKIKAGYLVVFDARYNQVVLDTRDGCDMKPLKSEFGRYFNMFTSVPDFKVKNTHQYA